MTSHQRVESSKPDTDIKYKGDMDEDHLYDPVDLHDESHVHSEEEPI